MSIARGTRKVERVEETKKHLDLLGIFHYVAAGLTLVCGGGYGLMFVGMSAAISSASEHAKDRPPPEFLWLFGGMGLLFVVAAAVTALLLGFAGWCLRERKAWIYCMVVAAISLIHMPIGTVLGVFTIIVLMRPEAKALFAGAAATRNSP
jgi:hypothetical protein